MKDPSRMFRDHNLAFTLPFLVVILGLPIPALAQLPTINFGQQFVGTTSSPQHAATVYNPDFYFSHGSVPSIGGSNPSSFQIDPHTTCGYFLGPQKSCDIYVVFSPTSPGTQNGQVVVTDDLFVPAQSQIYANLTGTGTPPSPPPPPPTFSPCDVNKDGRFTVEDVQLTVDQILYPAFFPPTADINHDGVVNVLDLQRVVNAVLNRGCNTS